MGLMVTSLPVCQVLHPLSCNNIIIFANSYDLIFLFTFILVSSELSVLIVSFISFYDLFCNHKISALYTITGKP